MTLPIIKIINTELRWRVRSLQHALASQLLRSEEPEKGFSARW